MPDRAVVNVSVDADGNSREDAYGKAAPLAKGVDEVITSYQPAIDRSVTAALVVHPRTRWRKGENVRTGWQAVRTSVLEVSDFSRLGDLVAELVGPGGAVSGPFWQLDADSPANGQARRLAAEDARRRCEVYAEALGLSVSGIA